MTIHYPDIWSGDDGIGINDAHAVCIKVTQGTDYINPIYDKYRKIADANKIFNFGYHFLERGNAKAQAQFYHHVAEKYPCMVDVETNPADQTMPTISDVVAFVEELRALGGTCNLDYLPDWYWVNLGKPSMAPLIDLGMSLVSSNYVPHYTDNGPGWAPYGGRVPVIWQFTNTASFGGRHVDMNAFKGNLAQLKDVVLKSVPRWQVLHSDGHTSLADLAARANTNPASLLRHTATHYGQFDDITFHYLNDLCHGLIFHAAAVPKGAKFWAKI